MFANLFAKNSEEQERPPSLGGGPLGLGDPDDKRLRKTEKDLIIGKMVREEATERCFELVDTFFQCASKHPFLFSMKCKEEKNKKEQCVVSYATDPEFIQEITDKYLHARSHYRRTGVPLEKVERKKWGSTGMC